MKRNNLNPLDMFPDLPTKFPGSARLRHYLGLSMACMSLAFNIEPVISPFKKAVTASQTKTSLRFIEPNE